MPDRVLVAIPTRDRPGMLGEALRSLLAQDDPDWVRVAADSGGRPAPAETDDGGPLPRDARIHVTRCAGATPGRARNAALTFGEERVLRAAAPLVAFLDDDDLWAPGHLSASR